MRVAGEEAGEALNDDGDLLDEAGEAMDDDGEALDDDGEELDNDGEALDDDGATLVSIVPFPDLLPLALFPLFVLFVLRLSFPLTLLELFELFSDLLPFPFFELFILGFCVSSTDGEDEGMNVNDVGSDDKLGFKLGLALKDG